MANSRVAPTGVERSFGREELIVSKTDSSGRITYANDVFLRISGYGESELLGQPHSLIRHPDMPRCVFKLLWESIASGSEIFAYVNNLSKNGDHYWVLAHVTPSFDAARKIIGYHSSRRVPEASALQKVKPLYARLLAEEQKHGRVKGVEAGAQLLQDTLTDAGMSYGEFVFSL